MRAGAFRFTIIPLAQLSKELSEPERAGVPLAGRARVRASKKSPLGDFIACLLKVCAKP